MKSAKCICQICQCGRHKCSHLRVKCNKDPFCKVTEYSDKYIDHPREKILLIRPKENAVTSDVPFGGETTHRHDYVGHPLEKKKPKPKPVAHKTEGTFQEKSVYTHEYTAKEISKRMPIKPQVTEKTEVKFNGEPIYTSDYKQWELTHQDTYKPKYQYSPSAPFDGEPVYTTDYKDHGCVKPPDGCRPLAQPVQSGPVDAENYLSAYQKSYLRPPSDFVPMQAVTPKHSVPNSGPFNGISTFTADYIPKNIDKPKPFKPEQKIISSDTPFSNDTTHRDDYKQWPTQEIFKHIQEPYRPNSAEFIDDTTYNKDFVPINSERQKPFKPQDTQPDPNREFSDKTNYGEDYRKWPVTERRKWSGVKYKPPQVRFEGKSIHNSDYVPHPNAVKEALCTKNLGRHTDVLNANGFRFDGETNYHIEYSPKEMTICPAAILGSRSDIVFEREDDTGHQFYVIRALEKPIAN